MEELIHRSKKQMKDMNLTVYKYFIVHPLPWKTSTISKILGLNAAHDAEDINAENVPWEVRTIRLKKRKNFL